MLTTSVVATPGTSPPVASGGGGGTITDYKGRPFETEGKEVVASNGPLHPALVELTGEYTG
jgi:hypothetical protein